MESSHRQQIETFLKDRKFAEADALLLRLQELNPEEAELDYFRGVSAYFQGRVGPTLEALERCLKKNPQHTDAAICLSVLLNDIGKYDQAKTLFQQANQSVSFAEDSQNEEIHRKFAVKHVELAELYLRYKRMDDAIRELQQAVILVPGELHYRVKLAQAYAKRGWISRSIQELEWLKREHPTYSPARIQLGQVFMSQGQILEAELEWETLLSFDPGNTEALALIQNAKRWSTPS